MKDLTFEEAADAWSEEEEEQQQTEMIVVDFVELLGLLEIDFVD